MSPEKNNEISIARIFFKVGGAVCLFYLSWDTILFGVMGCNINALNESHLLIFMPWYSLL